MKTLPPDLEALMPEPVATVDADGFLVVLSGGYIPTHATLYTATQMREAILAATERAAKVVEQVGPKEGSMKLVTEGFAAAIRGANGGGQI